MAENAIIEKILDDATKSAESYRKDAIAKQGEIEKAYQEYAQNISAEQSVAMERECANILERKKTVATLDTKKIILQAKQEVIDEAFAKAKDAILKDCENYRAFMAKEIENHFENGDSIIIGKGETVLDEKFFQTLATTTKKEIVVEKERGSFVGGIIIKSTGYDKNLCLDTILKTKREEIEAEVSKILFQ